ncbi:MAG TPA: FAD-dependent monooxygenase, partial [Gemmatimonadales bacterium]|nr:FAD-dependent monooxygenase [Gemmatimonadales bacterium]
MKGSGNAEVAVLGAGPAGAVAARLLAEWGHRVVLLHRTAARPGIAESLPPSLGKLLAVVGAGPAVEAAGFYRSRGNTVWWEGDHPRVEPFAAGAQGYQVLRPHLDTLLQSLAHGAGAELWQHVLVRAAHPAVGAGARGLVEYQSPSGTGALEVDWILDATGRTALVSRALGFRQPEPGQRTLAVIGVWHSATGWPLPDETHTLVEAYAQGWAWSVPL